MVQLSKETFGKIKTTLMELIDSHRANWDAKWGNQHKIIGKAVMFKDTESGRTSQFNAEYYFNPIKGVRRPDVRREFAEVTFFYQTPPPSQFSATPADTYEFFTDTIITHYIQELKPHTENTGTLSYTRMMEDIDEKEGIELLNRLKAIIQEEKEKGMIRDFSLSN